MTIHINVPDHVENEAAYVRAAEARIRANAAKKGAAWLAVGDRKELMDWLQGQYNGQKKDDFLTNMFNGFLDWGTLTEKQEAAVRAIRAKFAARKAEWAAKRVEEAAKAEWVGTVGERTFFTAKLVAIPTYQTDFGTLFINILKAGDNTLVYKGNKALGEKGEVVTFKATVKAHDTRDGVKQTIVARPANVELVEEEEERDYFDGENIYGLGTVAQGIAEDRLGQRFEDIGDYEAALEGDVD